MPGAGVGAGVGNTGRGRGIPTPDLRPLAPSDLVATALSDTEIGLTWTDNSDDEDNFVVERSPNGITDWVEVSTPVADAESDTDTGLDPETTYYYRVGAENAHGVRYSNVDNATTEEEAGISSIAPDAGTGPVFADDFNRADSDTPGNGWVEYGGDFDIVSNKVSILTAGIHALQQEGVSGGAMFAQALVQGGHEDTFPALALRTTAAASASAITNGYLLRVNVRDEVVQLYRVIAGAYVLLDSEALTLTALDDNQVQFYTGAGVQHGWVYSPTADVAVEVVGADTTFDAEGARNAALVAQAPVSHTMRYDDVVWAGPSPYISVSGLSDGMKAKVLNSGESVVATATESGGTATIDCSRFGGATEIIPIGGWAALIVTDADDNELARYDAAGIYPGYAYTAS